MKTNIRVHSIPRIEKLFKVHFETNELAVDNDIRDERIADTINYLFDPDSEDDPDVQLIDFYMQTCQLVEYPSRGDLDGLWTKESTRQNDWYVILHIIY